MKKVSVIGHFATGLEYLDGQTVKTRILAGALEEAFGDGQVLRFDTHGGKKTLLKAPFMVAKALRKSQNTVMLPAHNGLRVFGRLLPWLRPLFRGRKIHYVVIGGWLPRLLEDKKNLKRILKKFDGIYVETDTMRRALEAQGFENVQILPNCKALTPLAEEELICPKEKPYKLCTFSRVMKEKGIEDAIEAVKAINETAGETVYTLDIYGQVDLSQTEWFEELRSRFPSYVTYGGLVPFDKSVEVLKDYFALLFPTRFYTEGIPGTIIDAYAAGVPVVSARWESFSDIVEEGVTGIGYEFESVEDLKKKLLYAAENRETIASMKPDCLAYSKRYLPGEAIECLTKNFA